MRRLVSPLRPDLDRICESLGFAFAYADGEPYWDETVRYEFALEQVERDIEQPTGELYGMCLELASRAVKDEHMLCRLGVPEPSWDAVAASWRASEPSLYGRFDLCYTGDGPAKLLEFNGDTPTSLYEAAVFQWYWLEAGRTQGWLSSDADQFNSLHEALIARWRYLWPGRWVHLAAMDNVEDRGTVAYLADTALQAGRFAKVIRLDDIGVKRGRFVDLADPPIDVLFKLYPWEWLLRDPFGQSAAMQTVHMVEPAWKMMLSSKGILPLLWRLAPGHPNLLPAYFEDEAEAVALGKTYVRKPIHSREGANISIVLNKDVIVQTAGPYDGPAVLQAFHPLPSFDGMRPVVGSWIVGDRACGMGLREDATAITVTGRASCLTRSHKAAATKKLTYR